mmetsp:Transcript_68708/g.123833  ORF Transcript_68708/g.123833 Transcript_68708/m.123833 type:complete len:331 (-) Transcript_68708:921-1913(-)
MVVAPELLKPHLQFWSGHALGRRIAPVVLVELLEQGAHLAYGLHVVVQVHAADVDLQRHAGLSGLPALQEAAADAAQAQFGTALLGDAAHVMAAFAQDPLDQAKLVVIFQTEVEVTDKLGVFVHDQLASPQHQLRGQPDERITLDLGSAAPSCLACSSPVRLDPGGNRVQHRPDIAWLRGWPAENRVVVVGLLKQLGSRDDTRIPLEVGRRSGESTASADFAAAEAPRFGLARIAGFLFRDVPCDMFLQPTRRRYGWRRESRVVLAARTGVLAAPKARMLCGLRERLLCGGSPFARGPLAAIPCCFLLLLVLLLLVLFLTGTGSRKWQPL